MDTTQNTMRLTPLARGTIFIGLAALGVASVRIFAPSFLERVIPSAKEKTSMVPLSADLPLLGDDGRTRAAAPLGKGPGCAQLPEVRVELWAWNSQMGLMLANGGPQSAAGSLMCQEGVNAKLMRQDDGTKMREDLVTFANELKHGQAQPKDGVAFVAIMGDGSATFLAETNKVLGKLGPDFKAKVVGSSGYSWGEDKFMGPAAWKQNPSTSRGGLVAGVVRDGDWNIAQKWLAENRLCNNPDDKTWDPNCLNWVNTPGYVEAAQAYIAGVCEDRKVVANGKPTGETKHVCVDGVVTWTPGDVDVAQKKGGLVSIVSTKEYRGQMPQVLIGIDAWMKANRKTVDGMLSAMLKGGDRITSDSTALDAAAAVSAQVYGEGDAAYWKKYFQGTTEPDAKGQPVELGGSRVNNLADDLYLFGVKAYAPDSANLFAATYTVFGNIVSAQYPELVPSFPAVREVLDTSYLEDLAKRGTSTAKADLPKFDAAAPVKEVVSNGSWNIAFESGKASFSPGAKKTLDELFDQLVIAGGAAVEIHGHTDSQGDAKQNLALSEARAFAVKRYLEARSAANFPEGRVRIFAHGQENPIAPNATPEGRAMNRRVQIIVGTTKS